MKRLFLLSILALTACGTIFSGSSQTITFDSNVKEGIQIYADGALVCNKTPCVVNLDRHSGAMTIIAKADGYEDAVMQNKTKINTVAWGNLLSCYSWTTDFATSSMWKYSQDGVYINMIPKNTKKAELDTFTKEAKIKHFALFNYAEIKSENPEYINALSELTKKDESELTRIIAKSTSEVELAHNLI